jgi:hypothetical protein
MNLMVSDGVISDIPGEFHALHFISLVWQPGERELSGGDDQFFFGW